MKLAIGKPHFEFLELWENWNERLTDDGEITDGE